MSPDGRQADPGPAGRDPTAEPDRRTADELRQSEERLRFALDLGNTGYWEMDLEDHTASRTPLHDRIFGYDAPLPEWTYEMFLEHVLPEDRAEVDQKFRTAIEERQEWDFRCRIRRKDGQVRWIWATGRHLSDGTGGHRRMAGIVQDITGSKRAEETVREAQERLRLVTENSRDGINLLDLRTGKYIYMNPAQVALTGFTPEEINNIPAEEAYERTHPDDRHITVEQQKRIAAGEETPETVEYRWKVKSGEYRWFSDSRTLVRDERNRPIALVGISRDITERKRAEEALERGRRTFAELVERAPFGIYIVDSRFCIAHMNAGSQEGAFRNVRPIIGRDFSETMRILWPEPVAAEIISHFRHTLDSGEPYYSPRFVNPRHDIDITESYEWELHRMTLPDGNFGVICYYYDSTKLREAEQEIRESEERFRAITEASLTPVGVGSLDGTILYANRAYERLFGFEPGELLGRRAPDLYWDAADRDRWVADVREGRPVQGIELRMKRKDGSPFWAILSITPVTFGGKTGIMGTVVDISGRRAAEEALRASELKLRGILDATQESIWMFDREGVVLLANAIAVARIGKGAAEIIGRRMEQIIPPELARSRMERLAEVLRTGRPVEFEDERAGMNFRHSFYPAIDAAGAVTAVVSFSRDITRYKMANAALRESEQRLKHLASFPLLNPNPVLELDLAGKVIYSNPFANRIVREARLSGPADLLPADMPEVFAELRRHPGSTVIRVIFAGDRVFQVNIFQPAGLELLRVYGVDITERKRAEDSLAETRDYLEKLMDYANAPIIVWSPDSRITRFNRAFEELSGYKAGEVLGKKLELLFPEESKEASLGEIARTLAGGQWETIEIPILRKDGATRMALWNSANIYDKDGRTVISTIAQGQDITDRKRGELALQKARERNAQQEKLAAIGRLAGGVAHELRNPLAAMKNAAYYLGMTADLSDQSVAETLTVLNREIARSDSIISSLLGLARPAQTSRREVDLSALLEAALSATPPPAGITLESRLDDALPPAAADRAQLSIVFGNILRNAFEAMPRGGRLLVSSSVEGGLVTATVADSGDGMPPEVLERLFEPLFTTKPGGTGLGLSVAKMLVEGMGGTIEVRSEPGKGSAFTVRLPVKRRG